MIKYIVSWCLIYTYWGGANPTHDEFGRPYNGFTVETVQYVDTVCSSTLSPTYKEFTQIDSALLFMKKAKMQNDICHVKIKEVQ